MTTAKYKYRVGIIAAGEGARLKEDGIKTSKPLIKVNNEILIDRLIEVSIKNGADSFVCIINEESADLEKHLKNVKRKIQQPFELIIETTESSFHSFYHLSKYLKPPFLLTTADSVFQEKEFQNFLNNAFDNESADAVMAVTDFIDDEKPLYTAVDNKSRITGFLDEGNGTQFVTGGLYLFKRDLYAYAEDAMKLGVSRLRNFFRFLVEKELSFSAYPFSKIVDVDHASDIKEAENLLNQ